MHDRAVGGGDDAVAAVEHALRAEHAQARGERAERSLVRAEVGRAAAPPALADAGHLDARGERRAQLQQQSAAVFGAFALALAHGAARCVGEPTGERAQRRALRLQPRRGMLQATRRLVDALHARLDGELAGAPPALAQRGDLRNERGPVGHGKRRRRGRRRGANVGDEVADGEVGLVADAADDRQDRLEHRACHRLLVERPQILDRAAAATHDQDVDLGAFVGERDRRGDLGGGARTLHRGGIQENRQRGEAARERRQHVGQPGGVP